MGANEDATEPPAASNTPDDANRAGEFGCTL